MNITIIPVGNIDDEVLKSIASVIGGTFNLETEIAGKKAVPKSAYNARRKQFSAHEFIEIAKQENGWKILAITDVDIYAKNLNFVFGQAELKGKACVVSTHRLAAMPGLDGLLIKRACKEAVHELGHTFGLHHCSDMSCVMCFSPNVEGVDAKNVYFCSACIEKYARSEKV
mgnify:CR=1 FL=1